jgi:uncharacterized membrane protein YgdD (TMEM256/DUF423 family)
MQQSYIWLALAGVNGFMAVAVGAFAAHGVKVPAVQALLHTGAEYQGMYAISGLTCFNMVRNCDFSSPARFAGMLFGVGGLIFGCSLYMLALSGVKLWGVVTPIGGLMLLAGWAAVVWGAFSRDTPSKP